MDYTTSTYYRTCHDKYIEKKLLCKIVYVRHFMNKEIVELQHTRTAHRGEEDG